jgi:hypothetical protein
MHSLEKRAPKEANACDFTMRSLDYPSTGEGVFITITPKKYGFDTNKLYSNYDWAELDR